VNRSPYAAFSPTVPPSSPIRIAPQRAIAAAKKKNDRIHASQIADCLRCNFLPECHLASTKIPEQ
jgi:hypothetical protein